MAYSKKHTGLVGKEGYRDKPRKDIGNVVSLGWSFIGAFSGIALIEGVYSSSSVIQSHGAPVIIGSFGAAAVLEYNSIESPLAQPRNLVLGHFLSALLGVCITKLFALLPQARFDNLRWVAGGLAVGASSVVMGLTKTIHPPAGATALLAATSPDVTRLGWYLLPLVLLGCTLMLASACVINNIQRQFPMYWWTHVDLSDKKHRRANSDIERASQAEKEEEEEDAKSGRLYRVKTREEMHFDREHEIKITAKSIVIPDWLAVDDWERNVLDILRALVRESADEWVDPSQPSSRSSESTEVTIDGDEAEPPASRGEHSALSK